MPKRLTSLVLLAAFLAAAALTAGAAPPKAHARHVIRRTAVVLAAAQRAAARGHKYAGLALAVGHQRYARRMYVNGRYLDAILHSLRARELAIAVLRRNGAALVREAVLDNLEKGYTRSAPPGKDLDTRIAGEDLGTDEDAAKAKIEPDIE